MSGFTVAFALLLWLPGHLALRLSPPAEGEWRDATAAERAFAAVLLSGALLLWIAVSLAILGWFTPGRLLATAAVPTAILAVAPVVKRTRVHRAADPGYGTAAIVLLLTLTAAGYYRPRFEQIIGGRDPTTYVLSGINLARTGSWVVHDEMITTFDTELERRVFVGAIRPGRDQSWGGGRFVGWYLMDPDTGRVVPQGLPLYPAIIAIGYLIAGVSGALHATTTLAIAAVVALFFLGRRLLNFPAGLTAAMLLLVSPAQVWFSRFANAESVAQLLVLGGLYGLLAYRRGGGWAYGLIAAVAFGLCWQAHVWMVWLVLPLSAVLVYDLMQARVDRQAVLSFWGPLTALGLQALAVYLLVTEAYMRGVLAVLRWSSWALAPGAVGLGLILLSIWWWGRRRAAKQDGDTAGPAAIGWVRKASALVLVVAAAYGYWVRPLLSNAWAAESMQRLGLAVTGAALVVAVGGLVILLLDRRHGTPTMVVLAVALGIMVPVLWHPSILRTLMWSLRRYQSFLPLVFLFVAVPLWARPQAWSRRIPDRWRAVEWGVNAALSLMLVVLVAVPGVGYRGFKQPGEAVALVEQISATLEDDAVLVFEARSGWGVLDLAPTFAYWKGHDVVWLHSKTRRDDLNAVALRDFVRSQAQRGRPVYYFTQGFNHYMPEPRMERHGRWWFHQQQLEEIRGALPRAIHASHFPFSVYRLEASGTTAPLDGILDVGYWDDNYVGEALPWESNWIHTARWTRGTAYFWLPGLDEDAREIVVHAMTVEGSEAFDRTLRARLDGIDLGEIPLEQEWTDYVFTVPSDWRPAEGSAPRLELYTEPLQPDAVTGNGDTRYLGVLVNAILWR